MKYKVFFILLCIFKLFKKSFSGLDTYLVVFKIFHDLYSVQQYLLSNTPLTLKLIFIYYFNPKLLLRI